MSSAGLKTTATANADQYQALFAVVQGAQYEDLRRQATRDLVPLGFDGYGIGGALEKHNLGTIVRWVCEELPENRPRHLLGISEPDDMFTAIENGADTFDCVSPSRVARNGQLYSKMRYLSVQLLAIIRDGVAEQNARHANAMADRLAHGLAEIPGVRLLFPVEINEIFVFLPDAVRKRLGDKGYSNQLRTDHDGPHYRLVPAWNTTREAIDAFVAAARGDNH